MTCPLLTPWRRLFLGMPCVALGLALSSCTSMRRPGESELTPPPSHWQHGRSQSAPLDTAALTRWWQRFHDPVLNELISGALQTSPDIRTALSRIEESRARRGVERAALFPTLNAGVSGQTSRRDTDGSPISSDENYSATLDVSWELDLFGKQRQLVKAASADLAQAAENYYAAQVTLTADLAEAYVTLRQAEAQLAVAEDSVKTRTETTQITTWKEQAGNASALDRLQSESTLEQARAAIPTLKRTIAQTRNQLTLLSGKTPGALDALLARRRPIPEVPARLALGIPAETLRQRPDVRAAERGIEAAVARTRSAERERLPSLTLSGSLGLEALKAGRLFTPETVAANALGQLAAPIFDAGRIRSTIAIQSAQERQAFITYESTVLTALSEVENALIAVQRNSERLAVLDRAVVTAREAATLARQQYEAGQVDLLVVLEAQRTLLSVEDQRVSTQGDEIISHVQLFKALGGGWPPR